MNKQQVLEKVKQTGVVAVVRAENSEQAKSIINACLKGGITAIEITFTVPGALELIRELSAAYEGTEVIIGAGTVLDRETAKSAVEAGAKFVVSPCLVPEVVEYCVSAGIACMPGAMTVKETVEGMKAGADIIKVFPGELFGPAIIKAFKAPLPNVELMPTGGVNPGNICEWIKAGAVAVGVGGQLTAGAKTGDWQSITDIAGQLIENVRKGRLQK